ncbi:hypothetical protein OSSY52_20740 [Tepiditoga spiralis]|uniref:DUF721 domain-containing protein n=1 Tax=Tepiditoga spiralis TaxID=2108365 RepID=A0A7G1GA43_9BACT|nr:DciA family protein [Tepiditoga spiralis]BBE31933.1 hypothetical protein OSSY52_20740 [Tepiditoga spiralis]
MSDFIKDILKSLSKKDKIIKKIYNTSSIEDIWNNVIEKKLKKYTKIENYETKNKILIVSCNKNIVMQEILFKKNEIIKIINEQLNEEIVVDIKVIRR